MASKGKTVLKYTKKNMICIKGENSPESLGTSFLKIHWLEPKLFQFKNWFQLRSSFPVGSSQEWKILVGINFWIGITLVLINVFLKMKYQ